MRTVLAAVSKRWLAPLRLAPKANLPNVRSTSTRPVLRARRAIRLPRLALSLPPGWYRVRLRGSVWLSWADMSDPASVVSTVRQTPRVRAWSLLLGRKLSAALDIRLAVRVAAAISIQALS